tara:strand:+ start:394 stop:567 length:174 start_codon:yes stop_codon:yes gene_type:complete
MTSRNNIEMTKQKMTPTIKFLSRISDHEKLDEPQIYKRTDYNLIPYESNIILKTNTE